MRPSVRPEKQYTLQEMIDRVHQHFLVEGNKKCMDDMGFCIYAGTGCLVGCLVTEEDAKVLDIDNHNGEMTDNIKDCADDPVKRKALLPYFNLEDAVVMVLLADGQRCHDWSDDRSADRILHLTPRLTEFLTAFSKKHGLDYPPAAARNEEVEG